MALYCCGISEFYVIMQIALCDLHNVFVRNCRLTAHLSMGGLWLFIIFANFA